ncbi:CopG family transcriptional regulator [candidate division KSB1 bacterium]|nr:CopG family transcriptional regulator [candidate division KSB1 bacterium]
MTTIQLTLDEELRLRVDEAVQQQQTTWPEFLREALIHYLERLKVREQERQHREGYQRYPVQKGEFDVWEEEQVWSV